jgi:(p)ppGpp synthase/HD superfamily hydrolase
MSNLQPRYSESLDRALIVAALAHQGQYRKGTHIPYVMHPFHVALLLDRHGFSEPVVIAGVLHDVLEDIDPHDLSIRESFEATFALAPSASDAASFRDELRRFLRESFGDQVLDMVEAVTEKKADDAGVKRSWRVRKDEQLAHAPQMDLGAIAVKAADALHNAVSIVRDVRANGRAALDRFNALPEETLWYYGSVAAVVRDRLGDSHSLAMELDERVRDLTEAVATVVEPVRSTNE